MGDRVKYALQGGHRVMDDNGSLFIVGPALIQFKGNEFFQLLAFFSCKEGSLPRIAAQTGGQDPGRRVQPDRPSGTVHQVDVVVETRRSATAGEDGLGSVFIGETS